MSASQMVLAPKSLRDTLKALHLSAESLEHFSLDSMPATVRDLACEHLRTCERCCHALRAIEPASFVHIIEGGPIHFRVTRLRCDRWYARYWGAPVDCGRTFRTLAGAEKYLTQSLRQVWRGHKCLPQCGLRLALDGPPEWPHVCDRYSD